MKSSSACLTVAWLTGVLWLLGGTAQAQPMATPEGAYPPAAPYYQPQGQACPYESGGYECPPQQCASSCRPCFSAEAEYLLGIRKSRFYPELVTRSIAGTSQADAGVLGLPSTRVLFGGEREEPDVTTGVRLDFTAWLDHKADTGLGFAFFGYEPDVIHFSAAGDGSPTGDIIARPIFNALLDAEGSQLVAFPGLVSGNVNVDAENRIYGTEVFLRQRLVYGKHCNRFDLLLGYQFTEIDDTLMVSNHLTSLDPTFLIGVGSRLDAFDSFRCYNVFHGGLLGVKYLKQAGPWSVGALAKVGLGSMRQTAVVSGGTTVTAPDGSSFTRQSGLLVQDSNRGVYERDRFGVVPEGRLQLTYQVCPWVSAGVGYSFIYWNAVAFAGEQVDRSVDVTQTVPQPTFNFRESDTFVHSVNFVLQFDY